jgi:hypothetical protein
LFSSRRPHLVIRRSRTSTQGRRVGGVRRLMR